MTELINVETTDLFSYTLQVDVCNKFKEKLACIIFIKKLHTEV